MDITVSGIDGGKAFDWGKTSADYAKFRDIYPPLFYEKIASRELCVKGQRVLDIGTGTGVIPRNMYHYGADWVGTDISAEQIAQAKRLAEEAGMQIEFRACPAEQLDFPAETFDVITACQCFWYFDHAALSPLLARMLKPGGKLVVLSMEWLPFEDEIARQSEEMVLQFNPAWTGAGETRHPNFIPEVMYSDFTLAEHEEYDLPVHFTRAAWHGRMRACRGVGASLPPEQLAQWEQAHSDLLTRIAPEEFDILHFAAITILEKRS